MGLILLNLVSASPEAPTKHNKIKSSLSYLYSSRTYFGKSKELENLQGCDYLDLN